MMRVVFVMNGRVVLDFVWVRRVLVPLMVRVGHIVVMVWLLVAAIVDSAALFVVVLLGVFVVVPPWVIVVTIAVRVVAVIRVIASVRVAVVILIIIMAVEVVIVVGVGGGIVVVMRIAIARIVGVDIVKGDVFIELLIMIRVADGACLRLDGVGEDWKGW